MAASKETPPSADEVMTGFPVPAHLRVTPATIYRRPYTRWFMQHVREAERTASVSCGVAVPWPLPEARRSLDHVRLTSGEPYGEALEASATDAILVLHDGRIVDERYFNTMRPETPHLWQSVSKSLASCVAGQLVERGVLDAERRADRYVPELAGSAYAGALVRHLLDMQVGIHYSEDYEDEDAEVNELDRLYGARPPRTAGQPGSTYDFAVRTRKQGRHGRRFDYVSLNVNVLGWVMERATGTRMPDLIAREVWSKLGAEHEAYIALDGAGSAQSEGGFCSSLRDLARFGLALSRRGRTPRGQAVPAAWVDAIAAGGDRAAFARAEPSSPLKDGSYRLGFWVDGRPGGARFFGSGIYGQLLCVDPPRRLVVAKFSTQSAADDPAMFRLEVALCDALAAALTA